ncbi:MAG: serine/threonine protein kinase, partial [Chloroflexi bacterium]|nr:serine/threonine protein kinase [Chloroflexota bacterium]
MPRFTPGHILFDKYRIERLLGTGGFAEVYLATHIALNAPRALKVLVKGGDITSGVVSRVARRFQLEAQLGARFAREPHLVRVHDFEWDRQQGLLVLVTEYLPRGSLKERIRTAREQGQAGLPVDFVVRTAYHIALALAALHREELVHRDVKPSNILYDEDGIAKLGDLGIVQQPHGLTQRTELGGDAPRHPGTPEYMSPEQARTLDYLPPASDIYSLGATLFEALTLRKYKHQRPGTRVAKQRPDVPPWLDDLLAQMLSEDPKVRPWDGEELSQLLPPHVVEAPADAFEEEDETVDEAVALPSFGQPARVEADRSPSAPSIEAEEETGETGAPAPPTPAPKAQKPAPHPHPAKPLPRWVWAVGGVGLLLAVLLGVLLAGQGKRAAAPATATRAP